MLKVPVATLDDRVSVGFFLPVLKCLGNVLSLCVQTIGSCKVMLFLS